MSSRPWTFVAMVLVFSLPFWVLGAVLDVQLLPGLPVTVLMSVCPAAAACVLRYRQASGAGVTALLRRSVDVARIKRKRWFVPMLGLMPVISIVVYGLMRWQDTPVPTARVAVLPAVLFFMAFWVLALGEELGWSGYALEPMQDRWGAFQAAVVLGVCTTVWHVVPLLLMRRSLAWIAWWCLYAVSCRIVIVWLYNNTGRSVYAVSVFHATINSAYVLFPINGSYFDMRYGALATAAAAAIITVVWGHSARMRDTPTGSMR